MREADKNKRSDAHAQSAFYISPALLIDRDIPRELLLLRINDQAFLIVLPDGTWLYAVRIIRCIDDVLLIEGLCEDPLGCGVAERGVVSGDGGGGESGKEDLHFWIGVLFGLVWKDNEAVVSFGWIKLFDFCGLLFVFGLDL